MYIFINVSIISMRRVSNPGGERDPTCPKFLLLPLPLNIRGNSNICYPAVSTVEHQCTTYTASPPAWLAAPVLSEGPFLCMGTLECFSLVVVYMI